MFCKYITTTTPTQAQVLSDIVALYTGSIVDKNNLSASCDKTITELTTTVAAGWAVHDASAGTNTQVLKAPIYDNASQFKYLWISTNVSTYIEFRIYEGWNATTHIGTNPIVLSSSYTGQRVLYSQSFTLFLASTNRYAWCASKYGSTVGAASSNVAFCLEYTRWSPWDTTAAGYLPVVGPQPGVTRYKNTSGGDSITTGGHTFSTPIGPTVAKIVNASGQQVIPLVSIFVAAGNQGSFGGNVSEQTGIYAVPTSLGTEGDELTINGTTYAYFNQNSLTPGGFSTAVPKA